MVDPSQFNYMLNLAWVIATAIYAIIGAAGYLMFGDSVNEEVLLPLATHMDVV
jgi:solute carrier family 32 (vesicular inhibitory amino acid transporter)